LLSEEKAEAAASIIALSGGNMMSGDRLTELDSRKLEIFRKTLPSYGEAAKPVDLLESDIPTVFALKIIKSFAQWIVLGLFNPDPEKAREVKISMSRLGLDSGKSYLGFDFWKEKFLGEISGELKASVQPGGVTLLALHEKTGKPQFISSDRHLLQGAIELEKAQWNEENKIFSGISVGPMESSHNVFIYIPEEHPWGWNSAYTLFRDYDSYSLKLVDSHIIRAHLRFEKTGRIAWEIRYDEFFRN
jgi:hypothetical protein